MVYPFNSPTTVRSNRYAIFRRRMSIPMPPKARIAIEAGSGT
jgi:hypothetical protein